MRKMLKASQRAIAAAVLFTVALSFAAAGGQKDQTAKDVALTPTGTYPVTTSPVDLTFLTMQTVYIEDLSTNRFAKHWSDLTGVNVTWKTIPRDTLKESLNLVLASGDYPDVFFGLGASEQGIDATTEMTYGVEEKIFLPLNDLIDEHMPNLKKLLDDREGIREFLTSPDGNIYSLPDFNECYHCSKSQKVWVYQPWLDKLGLKTPETTQEFYEMLVAFKTKDPNGNGQNDEIPYAGALKGWNNNIETFILNSFIYTNLAAGLDANVDKYTGFYVDKGKIKSMVDTPEYREGLRYLNKLYKEGLIDNASFSQEYQKLTQVVEGSKDPVVGAVAGGYGGMFSLVGGERYKNFRALAPLKGPKGERNAKVFLQEPVIGNVAISSKCKYPEVVVRMIDYLYTDKGTLMSMYGFENEGWKYAAAGEKGLNGDPAIWKLLKPWDDMNPQNDAFVMLGVRANTARMRNGQVMEPGIDLYSSEGLEPLLYTVTEKLYEPYARPEKEIPTLRFLETEQQEFSTVKLSFANYVRQSLVKFITGNMDIDKDWDKYVQTLKDLNMSSIIEVNQKAYNRQMGIK